MISTPPPPYSNPPKKKNQKNILFSRLVLMLSCVDMICVGEVDFFCHGSFPSTSTHHPSMGSDPTATWWSPIPYNHPAKASGGSDFLGANGLRGRHPGRDRYGPARRGRSRAARRASEDLDHGESESGFGGHDLGWHRCFFVKQKPGHMKQQGGRMYIYTKYI